MGPENSAGTWWTPPAPRPRRRGHLYALIVILALGLVATGMLAWLNYEAGGQWRERALLEAERAEEHAGALADVESELSRTRTLLETSERDVARLESRLTSLASEKAGAEDSAAVATETVEDLSSLTVSAAEVGAALRECVARNIALTNDILADRRTDSLAAGVINERIDEVNALCTEAQDAYAQLATRLDNR